MNCDPVQRVLDAFLDGELDPDTAASVRQHLTACPACSAVVDTRFALSRELRQLPRYHAPEALRQALRNRLQAEEPASAAAPAPRRLVAKFRRTGPIGWLGGGIAVGYALALLISAAPLRVDPREQLLAQHVASFEAGRPRTEVISTDGHVVKPWFSGKIDFAPAVPDLSSLGVKLVGGRLDRLGDQPAAVLIYQVRRHHISLFVVRTSDMERTADVSTLRGFAVASWTRDGLSYLAIADVAPGEMQRFAALVSPSGP